MAATKELMIELRVPMSGEMFEDAEKISALKNVAESLGREALAAFGEGNYTVVTRTKVSVPARGIKNATATTGK